MTWLVWRRLRIPLAAALGLVVLAGLVAVVGRFAWLGAAESRGLLPCLREVETGVCGTTAWGIYRDGLYGFNSWLSLALIALPGVAGAVVGSGLFGGELGRGTHVFALSQSVSRLRWFGHGLLVAGLPVALAVALLTPIAAWWSNPFDTVLGTDGLLRADAFLTTGLVPAGYTVLAFCVAAAAGLLLRSTVGALGLALALQVAVLFLTSFVVRPTYLPPEREVVLLAERDAYYAAGPEGLYVDTGYLDAQGNTLDFADVTVTCNETQEYNRCLVDAGLVGMYTDYQPLSRYWPFQAIEGGLVLALAAAALGAGLWGLRRRVH